MHTHNPSSQDAGAGRLSLSPAWATEQNSFSKIKLNLGVVAHTCIPRTQRRRLKDQKFKVSLEAGHRPLNLPLWLPNL